MYQRWLDRFKQNRQAASCGMTPLEAILEYFDRAGQPLRAEELKGLTHEDRVELAESAAVALGVDLSFWGSREHGVEKAA